MARRAHTSRGRAMQASSFHMVLPKQDGAPFGGPQQGGQIYVICLSAQIYRGAEVVESAGFRQRQATSRWHEGLEEWPVT